MIGHTVRKNKGLRNGAIKLAVAVVALVLVGVWFGV